MHFDRQPRASREAAGAPTYSRKSALRKGFGPSFPFTTVPLRALKLPGISTITQVRLATKISAFVKPPPRASRPAAGSKPQALQLRAVLFFVETELC